MTAKKYLSGFDSRKITLREVNFGEKMAGGPQLTIAGRSLVDRPFELCGACGKVRKNGKIEHAVYCRYWGKEEKEKVIEACFLYREFTSEAIRMLLPVASFDVDRNIHSFVARARPRPPKVPRLIRATC